MPRSKKQLVNQSSGEKRFERSKLLLNKLKKSFPAKDVLAFQLPGSESFGF
jgi:hypothetical protein